MSRSYSRSALFVILAIALVLASCTAGTAQTPAAAAKPLKIGVIQPLTGPNAPAGQELLNGAKLAASEQNEKGGILGRKVEVISADATNAQQAVSAVENLLNEGAEILSGTYVSAVATAAIAAAAKKNILYWETIALAPNLTTQGVDNVVRIGPDTVKFAIVSIDFLKDAAAPLLGKRLGELSAVIAHEQSIYGTSVGEAEEVRLKELGSKVTRVAYNPAAPDLSEVVLKVKDANPDVWMITGYVADVTLLLKTARQLSVRPKLILLTGTGEAQSFIDALGADGMMNIPVITYPRLDSNPGFAPAAKTYPDVYAKAFGKTPIYSQALTAYSLAKFLYVALEKAGSTSPADVRKAVAAMDIAYGGQLPNGFGVKMDKNFDNDRSLPVACQWQGSNCVTVYPAAAAPAGAKVLNIPFGPWK